MSADGESGPATPPGVFAYLVIKSGQGDEALAFYTKAFGAVESFVKKHDNKIMHARMELNQGIFMFSEEFPEFCSDDAGFKERNPAALGGTCVTLHMQVEDVDATFKRAIDAGAKSVMEPQDMFWGDRFGKLSDPFGHEWSISSAIPKKSDEPDAKKVKTAD